MAFSRCNPAPETGGSRAHRRWDRPVCLDRDAARGRRANHQLRAHDVTHAGTVPLCQESPLRGDRRDIGRRIGVVRGVEHQTSRARHDRRTRRAPCGRVDGRTRDTKASRSGVRGILPHRTKVDSTFSPASMTGGTCTLRPLLKHDPLLQRLRTLYTAGHPRVALLRSRCAVRLVTMTWTDWSRCAGPADHDAWNAQ